MDLTDSKHIRTPLDIRSYTVCPITDRNWDKGISRANRRLILFSSSNYIFKDDVVTFPDSSIDRVEKVVRHNQYVHVLLENDAPDFKPNQPLIFQADLKDQDSMEKPLNGRSYTVCPITDRNWDKGINRADRKLILFTFTRSIFKDDIVTFPDGSVDRVADVKRRMQYLHVFLENDAPKFGPDQPLTFQTESEAAETMDRKGSALQKENGDKPTPSSRPGSAAPHPQDPL